MTSLPLSGLAGAPGRVVDTRRQPRSQDFSPDFEAGGLAPSEIRFDFWSSLGAAARLLDRRESDPLKVLRILNFML